LLGGSKKKGYRFQASHINRDFVPGKINIQSRIVPNDGNWIEIPPQEFAICAYRHGMGLPVIWS
jgi:hypothetical protein